MKVKEMERSTGVAWILTSPRSTGRHQGWVVLQGVAFAAFEGVGFLLHLSVARWLPPENHPQTLKNNLT